MVNIAIQVCLYSYGFNRKVENQKKMNSVEISSGAIYILQIITIIMGWEMKFLKINLKKIMQIYFIFWLMPILVIIVNLILGIDEVARNNIMVDINFQKIILRNLTVMLSLIVLGIVHNKAPYILYLYNSLQFSIILSISLESIGFIQTIVRVIPHGLIEIFALSLATLIGTRLKEDMKNMDYYRSVFLGIVILFIAALIETFITPVLVNLL